jgi:hypothetical protein
MTAQLISTLFIILSESVICFGFFAYRCDITDG